jgi:hypothetical protein
VIGDRIYILKKRICPGSALVPQNAYLGSQKQRRFKEKSPTILNCVQFPEGGEQIFIDIDPPIQESGLG